MKKILNYFGPPKPNSDWNKLLLTMKITVFLFFCGVINLIAGPTWSQNTLISLNLKDASLEKVFNEIEDNSEFYFLFNQRTLDVTRKVDIVADKEPIKDILNEILGDDVKFAVYDRQIILTKKDESQSAPEQQQKITGTVTNKAGEPLAGVSVVVKGTTVGTITGNDGAFNLLLPAGASAISFSFVGMSPKEMEIGKQSVFNVILEESAVGLEEVVVIGYGTAKKKDLTGAVVRVDADVYKEQPLTVLSDMFAGTVAGISTTQPTSADGSSSMLIRGQKSLNASTDPMIVLDGVIFNGSISDINPADIESIDILKDASSASVYGARAAAGVVIVTTKKGISGKPVISFSTQLGVTSVTNNYKPYDATGYMSFRQDVMRGYNPDNVSYYYDDPTKLPAGVTIDQWRAASNNPQDDNTQEWLSRLNFYPVEVDNYLAGKTVDWYGQAIQKGLRQNYDLSIGGKTDNFTYYWSLGYQNNEGVVRGDQFSTIRSRLNVDFKVTNWLNVGVNTQFADRDQSSVLVNMWDMNVMSPYGSMYREDGSLEWYPNSFVVANPMDNYYGQDALNKIYTLFASMYAKVNLPLGFNYKLSFQPYYEFHKDYNFWPSSTIYGGVDHTLGYGSREEGSQYNWIVDNILQWNKTFGIHSFDVTFLYSAEKNLGWSSMNTNENFLPNQFLGYNALQLGSKPTLSNDDSQETGNAIMGRVNYSLLNKYLFTASIRRDGYSAFGKKNPTATFPAAAVAWRISEEEFFPKDLINSMKLRVSWGVNGNRDIGAYSAMAQITPNLYYDGSNTIVGVYNSTLANNDLAWERTQSLNFGLDFSILKSRIDVSAEYYDAITNDLLMKRMLPEITGFTDITTNLGEIGNRGFELTVNTKNITHPNFTWNSNFVFSLNRNKIKKLFGDYEEVVINGKTVKQEIPDYTNEWFPGQAIDRIWNYDVKGIWQTNEAEKAATYGLQPGDFKVTDVNNDSALIDLDDKQFIGYKQPQYRLGFRNDFTFFKNFAASIFIRADLGQMTAYEDALHEGGVDTYDRRNTIGIPYWTPSNGNNEWSRLNTNLNVFGGGIMTYRPSSFLRIQDFSLSYTVPATVIERLKLSTLRIYCSIRNLYTLTKWPGWDPESGTTPMPKIYTFGINISL